MNAALFSQFTTLGSSVVLLFGIVVLCRRSLHAYIESFQMAIAGANGVVGYRWTLR